MAIFLTKTFNSKQIHNKQFWVPLDGPPCHFIHCDETVHSLVFSTLSRYFLWGSIISVSLSDGNEQLWKVLKSVESEHANLAALKCSWCLAWTKWTLSPRYSHWKHTGSPQRDFLHLISNRHTPLNIYNVLPIVFETRESRTRLQFSLGSGGYLDVNTHSRRTKVHASLNVRKDKPEGSRNSLLLW